MDDVLRAISSPGHHEEGGGDERPQSELGNVRLGGLASRLGLDSGGWQHRAQFLVPVLSARCALAARLKRTRICRIQVSDRGARRKWHREEYRRALEKYFKGWQNHQPDCGVGSINNA